jgi:hypothetical protein
MLLMAAITPASQEFRYREQTGADSLTFVWRTEQGRDAITVTVTQDQNNEFYSSVCTLDGSTLSWHHIRRPDTDVRAERIGNRIHFSGRFGGKEIKRSEPIDQRPWYQPLSYSLQRLVARGEQAATFWTIRPDTLDILAMRAEQSENETLGTGKQAFTARKVVIRLDGLLSGIWHAEYWFRRSDTLFVRYRGTHGPPGTAETAIHLIDP